MRTKMKMKSWFMSMVLISCVSVFLSGCNSKGTGESAGSHEEHEVQNPEKPAVGLSEPQFKVDQKFQEQLAGVFTSYVDLKEAFVSSNSGNVKAKAAATRDAVAKVDMTLLTGAAHHDWMSYVKPMQASLEEIQSRDDIEAQRKSFSVLSDNLYKSIKAYGLGGQQQAFYEYCPMAFNNEGGYWLSDEEEIRNPYFGDKMLGCGEVKERLK